MFTRIRNRLGGIHLSLKMKLSLGLSAIAVVLLISSIISILEYRKMSNYVSELIADNINSINVAQKLANVVDSYNLDILTVIGDESVSSLPDFDQKRFVASCDSLKSVMTEKRLTPLADSVLYSYSAYMLTSLELNEVLLSDFIDSRTWYFERLQPVFGRLSADIDKLSLGHFRTRFLPEHHSRDGCGPRGDPAGFPAPLFHYGLLCKASLQDAGRDRQLPVLQPEVQLYL